jgi:KaiC/GvpD/RAD55 family RecA-like ATPase
MGAGIPPIDPPAIGETSPSDPEDGARPKSVPEVLVDLATEGEPVPTGFPPLDRQFRRGGLIPGSILVIGGPPHTGKTTLAEQIGLHMAKTMPVVALFADEGVKPAARRAALMCHIPEHILDAQPARAVELAKAALAEHSFTLWPTEATAATASAVVAYVVEKFAGMPAVVILDSIQTIPMSDDDDASSPRLAAKALVSQCRRWASAHSITFILTSQSNRASYRSKKSDDNSEAIASFSETGAIEYMADVALVLALPDDSEIVQAKLVKNRLKGSGKSFSIRFSPKTYSMLEADDAEIESATILANSEKLIPVKKEIKSLLEKHHELSGKEIEDLASGRASYIRDALKSMVHHDHSLTQIKKTGRGGGFLYALTYPEGRDDLQGKEH